MKIIAQESYPGKWTAIEDNSYAGPESPIGVGDTEEEAIKDLLEQIQDVN